MPARSTLFLLSAPLIIPHSARAESVCYGTSSKGRRSIPLPTGFTNRFGHGIEFDADARYEDLTIDFEAIGEHLFALDAAVEAQGIGISRVIFDKPYLPRLLATTRGKWIEANIPFMQGEPWIRHDEHYHVDFAIACLPITE